ncbi:hypothetical protein NC652_040587 [Populus alba x Populus x berolinensis]|nr:hypothetical protein NC652_040587 [Populus alba x Populus x berolinensis]
MEGFRLLETMDKSSILMDIVRRVSTIRALPEEVVANSYPDLKGEDARRLKNNRDEVGVLSAFPSITYNMKRD